jgi:hypothetical protein
MSYRNPGNLFVGDPNAFLKSFLSTIEKHRAYYEKQSEKEEKEKQQLDYALAQFNKEMDYPTIAKTFGKDVADITKKTINERYVENGMFANANQQQRQEIYDEIGMGILNPLTKLGTAVKLDPTEIDLFGLDDGTFKDFLTNKINGFEVIMYSGGPALSFKMPNGATKILMADKIPDKVDLLKNKTDILTGLDGMLKNSINAIDYRYQQAEDPLKIQDKITGDIDAEATRLFGLLDDQTKRVLFNDYARSATDISIRYNDFPDTMTQEEKEKAIQDQDGAIMEYLKFQLQNGSRTVNRINMRLEQEQNPLNNLTADQRNELVEQQNLISEINKIYTDISDPVTLPSMLDFNLTAGDDPVTMTDVDPNTGLGVVNIPGLLTIDNEIVPAQFDVRTLTGQFKLANYMLEMRYGADARKLQKAKGLLRDDYRLRVQEQAEKEKLRQEKLRQEQLEQTERALSPEALNETLQANTSKIAELEELYSKTSSGMVTVDGERISKRALQLLIRQLKDDNEVYQDLIAKGELDPIEVQQMLTDMGMQVKEYEDSYKTNKSRYYINEETGEVFTRSSSGLVGISRAELKELIDKLKRRISIFGGQEDVDKSFAQ